MIRSAAVYLGSSHGKGEAFMDFARALGNELGRLGIEVVYGGENLGTMTALADGVLEVGGTLTGVFPAGFKGRPEIAAQHKDIQRTDLSKEVEVKDFAERKAVMEKLSDCAVVLPGSYGSLDELFTFAVNRQIGLHDKPAFVMNVNGYYDGLEMQVKTMKENGFIPSECGILRFCRSIKELSEIISQNE